MNHHVVIHSFAIYTGKCTVSFEAHTRLHKNEPQQIGTTPNENITKSTTMK